MAYGLLLNTVSSTGGSNIAGPAGTNARDFNGSSDKITGPTATAADLTVVQGQWTVEAFVRPDSLAAQGCIMTLCGTTGETSAQNAQVRLDIQTTGRLAAIWESGAGTNQIFNGATGTAMITGTWYHVCAVKNATHVRLYVNGTFYDQHAWATNADGGTSAVWLLGVDATNGTTWFNGGIRAVKLSKVAFDDSAVATSAALLNTTATFPIDENTHIVWHLGDDVLDLDAGGGEEPDATVPTITAVTAEGAILTTDPIELETEDAGDNILYVVISATYGVDFAGDALTETVYDGAVFTAPFVTDSTTGAITNGFEFSLERTGGWPSSDVTINVLTVDDAGNSFSDSFVYTTDFAADPGDVDPPTVENFSPAPLTTVAKSAALQFDVLDDTGLGRVIVHARFENVDQPEVVHDSENFTANYSNGTNSRNAIAGGWRYVVLRNGGWPTSKVYMRHFAVDTSGNETE